MNTVPQATGPAPMSGVTIYHNPSCGTSRNTLALIRHAGIEPEVVEYLKTPPSQAQLRALVAAMGITVRTLLRDKEPTYAELDLGNARWSDDELFNFIGQHPVLMNRPVVVTPLGTRLCRPCEQVLELLPVAKLPPFTKENGERVDDSGVRCA
jgi:arsenate reductase